jgi:hypothetical protein
VLTTYQRNIGLLLTEEDLLDDLLPDGVVDIEEDADHEAGDEHHDRSLDYLVLAGPFDFLQLTPRLDEEVGAVLLGGRTVGRLGTAVATLGALLASCGAAI